MGKVRGSKVSCGPRRKTGSRSKGPKAKAAHLENSPGLKNSQKPSRPPILGHQGRLPFSPVRPKEDRGRPTGTGSRRVPLIQKRGNGLCDPLSQFTQDCRVSRDMGFLC